jgi:hypothetical protein
MKTLTSLETSAATGPATQRDVTADLNGQKHCCDNLTCGIASRYLNLTCGIASRYLTLTSGIASSYLNLTSDVASRYLDVKLDLLPSLSVLSTDSPSVGLL